MLDRDQVNVRPSGVRRSCRGVRLAVVGALVTATAAIGAVDAPAGASTNNCGNQPCTWNFLQAKVPPAQPPGRYGAGVTVAVVDTWVDHTHPDLSDRVIGHAYCVDRGGRCRDNARAADACVHGTHVAGTVASARYGAAPQASVLAVQVLSYDPDSGGCSGSAEDVAAGIRHAVARGADVINLSLGGLVPGLFQSGLVTAAVRDAARDGAVLVFAAGNSTVPLSDSYGSDALLVAATGPNGRIASYSSRGGSIDLAAPGGDDGAAGLTACRESTCILSTTPKNSYGLLEGTSMAAPHVSGTAALLLGQHPNRGRSDVMRTLQSTARSLSGVRHGLLDATAALRLRAAPPARTTSNQAPTTTLAAPNRMDQPAAPTRPVGPYAPLRTAAPRPDSLTSTGDTAGWTGDTTRSPGAVAGPEATGPGPAASDAFPLPAVVVIGALLAVVAFGAVRAVVGSSGRRP